MKLSTDFKIRTGQPMPMIGEPVFVTTVTPAATGVTFAESYVFLPLPKQVIWRKAKIIHPDQDISAGISSVIDFDELIFDQARVDYELFVSKNFPVIYKEIFYRRQGWGDYAENNPSIVRLRLRGLFEKEIQAITKTSESRSLRDHLMTILQLQPIILEVIEENLG